MAPATRQREELRLGALLRDALLWRGVMVPEISDAALGRVVLHVGGETLLDLAADAVMMDPRPAWVREIVGLRSPKAA